MELLSTIAQNIRSLIDDETLRDRVSHLSQYVEYRILDSDQDIESALHLRSQAYFHAGATDEPTSILADAYDGADNSTLFGLYFEDQLCATVRLHLFSYPHQVSPALATFPDVLIPLLDAGETFIDANCFCVDPALSGTVPELAYLLLRIPFMAGEIGLGSLITATAREGHIGFYRRTMRGTLAASPRPYPGRKRPFGLVLVDFHAQRDAVLRNTPLFAPRPGEAEAIGLHRIGRTPARVPA